MAPVIIPQKKYKYAATPLVPTPKNPKNLSATVKSTTDPFVSTLKGQLNDAKQALMMGFNQPANFPYPLLQTQFPSQLQAFIETILAATKPEETVSGAATQRIANFLFELGTQIQDVQKRQFFFSSIFQTTWNKIPTLGAQLAVLIRPEPVSSAVTPNPLLKALPNPSATPLEGLKTQKSTMPIQPIPTPKSVAQAFAKTLLPAGVHPDTVTIVVRKVMLPAEGTDISNIFGEVSQPEPETESLSLTDAILKNFRRDKTTADSYQGITATYTDGSGKLVALNAYDLSIRVKEADIQDQYDVHINRYFSENRDRLIHSQKTQLTFYADFQKTQDRLSAESAEFIKLHIDQPPSANTVQLLSLGGEASTDILVFYPPSDRIVLYIPGDAYPLQEFNNQAQMRAWVMARIAIETKSKDDPQWQEAQEIIYRIADFAFKKPDGSLLFLKAHHCISATNSSFLSHFSTKRRLDRVDHLVARIGRALPKINYVGVVSNPNTNKPPTFKNTMAWFGAHIGAQPWSTSSSITTQLVDRQRERRIEDGKNAIVSNSDVHKAAAMQWLTYAEMIEPLIPGIGEELFFATVVAQIGLAADKAVNGDTQADREEGGAELIQQVVQGGLIAGGKVIAQAVKTVQGAVESAANVPLSAEASTASTVSEAVQADMTVHQKVATPVLKNGPRATWIRKTKFLSKTAADAASVSLEGAIPDAGNVYRVLNKSYIRAYGNVYEVFEETGTRPTWRIVPQDGLFPTKGTPVRCNAQGEWEVHNDLASLKGGMEEAVRTRRGRGRRSEARRNAPPTAQNEAVVQPTVEEVQNPASAPPALHLTASTQVDAPAVPQTLQTTPPRTRVAIPPRATPAVQLARAPTAAPARIAASRVTPLETTNAPVAQSRYRIGGATSTFRPASTAVAGPHRTLFGRGRIVVPESAQTFRAKAVRNLNGNLNRMTSFFGMTPSREIQINSGDFQGLNLKNHTFINRMFPEGSGFAYSNLSGTDFSNAGLFDAHFGRYARLVGANLSGANLSRADLREANLSGANLTRANLSRADLSRVDFREVNLTEANLSWAKLSGANLSGVDLRRIGLHGANLSAANLVNADLRGIELSAFLLESNLSGARLAGANLSGAGLSRANLSSADLRGANLNRADLSGANLRGADLRDAQLNGVSLNGANLSSVDLSGMRMNDVDLIDTKFTNANLDGTRITIVAPNLSNHRVRDMTYNHLNNTGRSTLISISRIDEKYNVLKLDLMRQCMTQLKAALAHGTDISDTYPSLRDVLLRNDLYRQDPTICDFIDTVLIPDLFDRAEMGSQPWLSAPGQAVDAFFLVSSMQTLANLSNEDLLSKSASINQLFYAATLLPPDAALQAATDQLRQRWLSELPSGLIVSLEKECYVDLSKEGYILLSSDKTKAIVVEHDFFKFISGEKNVDKRVIQHIYLMEKGNSGWKWRSDVIPGANLEKYLAPFPSLHGPYQAYIFSQTVLPKIFDLAMPPIGAGKTFRDALDQAMKSSKLEGGARVWLTDANQVELAQLIEPIFGELHKPQPVAQVHMQSLKALAVEVFGSTMQEDAVFAYFLLCLSAVWTKASASGFFGVEEDSLVALRTIAARYMDEAKRLSPNLISEETYTDWSQRFTGVKGKFTCTAILANSMINEVHALAKNDKNPHSLNQILSKIYPRLW